jgi:hypothetical protein
LGSWKVHGNFCNEILWISELLDFMDSGCPDGKVYSIGNIMIFESIFEKDKWFKPN